MRAPSMLVNVSPILLELEEKPQNNNQVKGLKRRVIFT